MLRITRRLVPLTRAHPSSWLLFSRTYVSDASGAGASCAPTALGHPGPIAPLTSAFVSKHRSIDPSVVTDYLNRKGLEFKVRDLTAIYSCREGWGSPVRCRALAAVTWVSRQGVCLLRSGRGG